MSVLDQIFCVAVAIALVPAFVSIVVCSAIAWYNALKPEE